MTSQPLRRVLTLWDGVVLAIGSIAGSGMLYLPSLTYVLAGRNVLLVWLGGTLLCVPLLLLFIELVRLVPDGGGIEHFLAHGLGPQVAATVPLLFLSLVSAGIPAGTLVAGAYLRAAIGGGMLIQVVGALGIVGIALCTNLIGAGVGVRVQRYVSGILLLVALVLCLASTPALRHGYQAIIPTYHPIGPIFSGMVIAFWAYAGFENLTFIAGEFRHPRRDFPLAMLIAFLIYGGLTIALTISLALLFPQMRVHALSGLLQLAEQLHPTWIATAIIVAFALTLMQLNTASWLWGMSRLLYASAQAGRLPQWFAQLDRRGLPTRAIWTLGSIFVVMTVITALLPTLLVSLLTLASSVFLFLYLLCLLAYLRLTRHVGKRLFAGGVLLYLLVLLASVGFKILYPLTLFLLAWGISLWHKRRLRAMQP